MSFLATYPWCPSFVTSFSRRAPLAFVATCALAAGARAQADFDANTALLLGKNPVGATHADIDGDGDQDLVFTNKLSSTVSVLWNQGDGTFAPHVQFATDAGPVSVEVADVDADGDLDLVTANVIANNISVLKNLGGGTFAAQTAYAISTEPHEVAIGDVNGDGLLDIVAVCTQSTGTVSILMNQGNGAFAFQGQYSYPSSVGWVLALLDLDVDGDLDVTVGLGSAKVLVLWNQGNGLFPTSAEITVPSTVSDLDAADLNGDGAKDLVMAIGANYEHYVVWNTGSSTLSTPQSLTGTLTTRPQRITLGDLDGDGDLDLLSTVDGIGTVGGIVATMNQGNGTFVALPYQEVASDTWGVTTVDLNSDGRLDCVVSFTDSASATVLHGRGDGTFFTDTRYGIGAAPRTIIQGDWNGDGVIDLAVPASSVSAVSILMGQGGGSFAPSVNYTVGTNPSSVCAGDFDGDGDLDMAVTISAEARVAYLFNQGNGTFVVQSSPTLNSQPWAVRAADMDGDGDLDLCVLYGSLMRLVFLRNNGAGVFTVASSSPVGTGTPAAMTDGDFDQDGDVDIVATSYYSSQLVLFSNQGDGTFATPTYLPVGINPGYVVRHDIDQDGDLDLVVANVNQGALPVNDTVSVLMNNGNGTFAPQVQYPAGGGPWTVAVADVNGDGAVDLVAGNSITHTATVLRNQGNHTFATSETFAIGGTPFSVIAGDYDGDTDPDLAISLFSEGSISIIRNMHANGTTFCSGDGSGTACPCANSSAPGDRAGCLNILGLAGALRASGTARLSEDHLVLTGSGMPNSAALYFQGTAAINGGIGAVFGDGLRCAGGSVQRLGTKFNAGNTSVYPGVGDVRVSLQGAVSTAGTRFYQVWYRDAIGFCTPANYNMTNGVTVIWGL